MTVGSAFIAANGARSSSRQRRISSRSVRISAVIGAADALVAKGEDAGAVLAAPVAVALVGVIAPGPQLLLAAVRAEHRRRPLVAQRSSSSSARRAQVAKRSPGARCSR